jgi:hypothetical protein
MRALSFFFALMVGLVFAFLAPAMAGGQKIAPEPVTAPMVSDTTTGSADLVVADLLADLDVDLAPALDTAA